MVVRKTAASAPSVPAQPAVAAPARRAGKTAATRNTPEAKPAATTTASLPESTHLVAGAGGKRRKKLAKAFVRPLDKILKNKSAPVDVRCTFPAGEYEQLVRIKRQLAERGIKVRKRDLLRAGLMLLSVQSDEDLQRLLTGLSALR